MGIGIALRGAALEADVDERFRFFIRVTHLCIWGEIIMIFVLFFFFILETVRVPY